MKASISVAGQIKLATTRTSKVFNLSQVVAAGLVARTYEGSLAPSGTHSVNLNLPSGVTEALVLYLYTDGELLVTLTSSNVDNPGPTSFSIRGLAFMTFAPGNGITAISLENLSDTKDVAVDLAVMCAESASADLTPYWS